MREIDTKELMKGVYVGNLINIWEDSYGFIYFNFKNNNVIVKLYSEEWKKMKEELKTMIVGEIKEKVKTSFQELETIMKKRGENNA